MVGVALLGFFWGVAVTVVTFRLVDGHSWTYWRTIDLLARCDELEARNQRVLLKLHRALEESKTEEDKRREYEARIFRRELLAKGLARRFQER